MSNGKQSVKLYTEEEIVSFLKKEFADEINAETFMENLTPIELPTDEEIEKTAISISDYYMNRVYFNMGVKYIIHKIGGNNEQ